MPYKTLIFLAIVISYCMYWTLSSVCTYNFVINKKTKMFNEIFKEIDPSLSSSKVYYFKELNCEPTKTEFKFHKFIDNFNHISVYIIQQLTTDIRGVKIEK